MVVVFRVRGFSDWRYYWGVVVVVVVDRGELLVLEEILCYVYLRGVVRDYSCF